MISESLTSIGHKPNPDLAKQLQLIWSALAKTQRRSGIFGSVADRASSLRFL